MEGKMLVVLLIVILLVMLGWLMPMYYFGKYPFDIPLWLYWDGGVLENILPSKLLGLRFIVWSLIISDGS